MNLLNYLRYIVVITLFATMFYNYTLTIEKETIQKTIDKKMPMTVNKKGFTIVIEELYIENISNNIVESKLIGTVKIDKENIIGKFIKKSINFDVRSKTIPKLNGSNLSFEPISININGLVKLKKVKGFLKKRIENINISIKKLDNLLWISSVKRIEFKENGNLEVHALFSKFFIFLLIPLFLLREIGLFLIFLYQKLWSPRKGYVCAKGELEQKGTCSSITKSAFKKQGFIAGMKAYRKSTKECKVAYKKIKKKEHRDNDYCNSIYCCNGGGCPEGLAGGASSCELGACASSPCEVGSC